MGLKFHEVLVFPGFSFDSNYQRGFFLGFDLNELKFVRKFFMNSRKKNDNYCGILNIFDVKY